MIKSTLLERPKSNRLKKISADSCRLNKSRLRIPDPMGKPENVLFFFFQKNKKDYFQLKRKEENTRAE